MSEVAKLVTMSLRQSIRRGFSKMNASRKYGGRNTLLVASAILIILMMGTLPMARSFTGTAYVPVFYRDSSGTCSNLGNNMQARFEPDHLGANTSFYETINVHGYADTRNTGVGDFKFDEQADGTKFTVSTVDYYPSTEVYGNFHGYKIISVNITISEPIGGTGVALNYQMLSQAVSYTGANFSSAVDEFETQISQNSANIWGNYSIISSSGTVLHEWSIQKTTSGTGQPYNHYGLTSQIAGEESAGYAVVKSGTDFRIETVIHPSTLTDFTTESDVSYTPANNGFVNFSTPCTNTFTNGYTDEEGDWTSTPGNPYTYGSANTVPASNEAYQFVYVG